MSLTLFKIYRGIALRGWNEKCGSMGLKIRDDLYISNLLDDRDIIPEDADHEEIDGRYTEWRLGINFCKTEHLSTSNAVMIEIEGRCIMGVGSF